MALVYATGPTTIRMTIADESGRTSVKDYVVPVGVFNPASDALTVITAIRDSLITNLGAILDGLLLKAFIVIEQVDDSAVISPNDCEIENMASVVVNLEAGEGKKGTISLPTADIGVYSGPDGKAKNTVDISDTALNTFIDMFKTTGGDFTISDGETLDDTTPMDAGKRVFRKSSRKD